MKRTLATALSLVYASATLATPVFINEIHYDNTGGDVGEFVEVAAPAGTDLSGWSVVFYNGSNGTSYATSALSGVVSEQSNGYGFVTVSPSSIQNGSPDGLALVDNNGNVVQFLSYEGTLTATNGIANGLTSTDIGVSEPGSTPVGFSLQLTGIGQAYADFSWAEPSPESPGSVNAEQSFGDSIEDLAPTVTITPADGDVNVAVDANIELQFSENVNVSGINPIVCASEVSIFATLSGGGTSYIVDPDQNFASNDQCSFTLRATDVTDLDGAPNNMAEDVTVTFTTVDLDASIDFVINEIHADPASDITGDANGDGVRNSSQDEFVELVNTGELATDISGWTLSDGVGVRHVFPAESIVEPGCAVVVFGGGTPVGLFGGALVQTASGGSVGLNNGGDSIVLSNGAISIDTSYGSEGGRNESLTLNPDITGEGFAQHSSIEQANGALFSPGTRIDGSTFSGCVVPDVAPTIVDVAPANGANNVSVDTSIAITFSEEVSIINPPTLQCSISQAVDLIATVEGSTVNLTLVNELAGNENCTLTVNANSVVDIDGGANPLQNTFSSTFTTAAPLVCNTPDVTLISAVQGNGPVSPLLDQVVLVQASVTAILPNLSGFVVQEEAVDNDADPATSEGIFVANGSIDFEAPAIGDVVLLNGAISERFGRTQLELLAAPQTCGANTIAATPFGLPVSSLDDLEALEGMLISSEAPLTVTDNFSLGRFGRVTLSNGRLFTPNNIELPGSEANQALIAANELNRVVLDDASDFSNPDVVVFPTGNLSANNTLRLGDTVSSLTGVLDFTRGEYMIYAVEEPVFAGTNPRTDAPELAPGNLTVASLNVLNYFTTLDAPGSVCGPSQLSCRGAEDNGFDSFERSEFERQKLKTVAAIVAMNADIVGFMEIENNGFGEGSAIADLVSAVNAEMGEGTYEIVNPGSTIGTDAITVAMIYKPSVVSLSGDLAILSSENSIVDENGQPLFNDRRNRPSLIQKFALNENGAEIVISVNHLKSKGGSCGEGDDDTQTGQGSCNLTRTLAAQALTTFLAENFGDTPTLIIGDLNAYAKEDPIRTILETGYTDLANLFGGAQAYSYTFGGEMGYLDHALASDSLLDKVVDTTEWHINADEPVVLDYNLNFKTADQQIQWYSPDAYRMSDHDPVLVSLQLDAGVVKGDWDGDGDVNVNDIRGLIRAIQSRQEIDMSFDLNEDGNISVLDVRLLVFLCTRPRCAIQ
ncbi:ExeM/NucH family extracellular endonuclease [Glaciecola sp. XM2]|uniref:ExeM/NucH family extracellular endonuclease n=1 Tax=Glaciecola sp. XM2 TaxID=1914931 RepID=UPI001BDF3F1D|nr:ExeM/NucH family extracellular endonuclease [Glaciecola sp. XM2]MBT1450040.1 ExeM/NucH family extracellular endonuclease [Glaciecola sp. XM2]